MKKSFILLNEILKHKEFENIILYKEDFSNLANALLFVLHKYFPKFKSLMTYLKEITKISIL